MRFYKKSNQHELLTYEGKKGRKHFTIRGWNGPIYDGDLEKIKALESVVGKVSFEGIGEFAHYGFLLIRAIFYGTKKIGKELLFLCEKDERY